MATDLLTALSKLLKIERDAVVTRLDQLNLDQILDLIDAVQHRDMARVRGYLSEGEEKEGKEADKEAIKQLLANPLFSKPTGQTGERKKKRKRGEAAPSQHTDSVFQPNMGDQVLAAEEEATVKITNAPNDTVGVVIDGELTMVKKKDLRPLEESIMSGITSIMSMPELARIQALAGIRPLEAACDLEVPPVPLEQSQAQEIEVQDVTPTEECQDACLDFDAVIASFDEIEKALPELLVKDAKVVRQRINLLLQKLNESHAGRAPKL